MEHVMLTRRDFLCASAALSGLALGACAAHRDGPTLTYGAPAVSTRPSGATVTVYDFGTLRIHAFTSPWRAVGNGTYVIEGPRKLLIVDTQFMVPFARDFRAYADTLGKPIDRVLITHAHPDHWFGLAAAFEGAESFALEGVKATIEGIGPGIRQARKQQMGELVPDRFAGVKHVIRPGKETFDGISFEVVEYRDAEADLQAVFQIPDAGVVLTGDLVYAFAHYYLTRNFDNWARILETLAADRRYGLICPGHGLSSPSAVYTDGIRYLRLSQQAFAEARDAEDLKGRLLRSYPDRPGEGIMNIYLPRLYPPRQGGAPPSMRPWDARA